jgi:group I intron endonuclease
VLNPNVYLTLTILINMKQEHIYMITNLINGKSYIGKHYGKLNDSYSGSGYALKLAYNKYTEEPFNKTILEVCTEDNVFEREIYWINYYNTFKGRGYNLTEGGESGPKYAGKDNAMYGKFGKDHPSTGHTMSEEGKRNVSKFQKGRVKSPEEIKQLSYKKTQEHKDKISKRVQESGGHTGTKNPNYGKGKPVLQYTKEGKFIKQWESGYRAYQELGISFVAISNCLRGKSKSSGDFVWKFEN